MARMTDKMRLDWLGKERRTLKRGWLPGDDKKPSWWIDGEPESHKSPRAAIDAAMLSEKALRAQLAKKKESPK